ncbi:uncharacterized protein PFL1_01609 [Pseudozyma flocculosa PF-1]|uniref:Uncharacterized protein n=1 Tax=Pseudozyma flocculosa TaxID=84751 RepID=A0A5C3EXJ7_9BASI|nr:uncharacterized protein PFL1_01609 [Pseudozyma flocculosa PF-1]EPQ30708.1 hypothetical protein PFL1_01609 [Pseudozyma flocculosa PF-1]SPO36948.1 uncharacterized protein PSFLO_02419 [Pseudozyma flocculosa]
MIDELIRHCIEEIGFDGEAGTGLDRLQHFIHDFHQAQSERERLPPQQVDESYRAFVFRALLSHPDVHVGTHAAGAASPGGAAKKPVASKAERAGRGIKKQIPASSAAQSDRVELIPDEEARSTSIPDLQQRHGDDLRLVLSADVVRKMLAGSAEKILTPSNYRFLQLVCRSREAAVVSTDLGAELGIDQKTVFYIAKKLIEAGLIVKLKARQTGTTASYFVATKFRDQCPLWLCQQDDNIHGASTSIASATTRPPSKRIKVEAENQSKAIADHFLGVDGEDDADGDADDDDDAAVAGNVDGPTLALDGPEPAAGSKLFETLDADTTMVWLTSRPDLVRRRLYAFMGLTSAKVALRSLLQLRLGLANSPKRVRRAFQAFLERLVLDGLVEVVGLSASEPVDGGQSQSRSLRRGFRLTTKGELDMEALAASDTLLDARYAEREQRQKSDKGLLERELRMQDIRVARELTFERQAHELVARAGASGITLRQMQNAFNVSGLIKRTLEMLVLRSEEANKDASVADMRIRQFHEFLGRERRLRLYSQHAWTLQSASDGYMADEDAAILASAGGFPDIEDGAFYTDGDDAIAKTRGIVSEAFVDNGRGGSASMKGGDGGDEDGNGGLESTLRKKPTGRPKGRLNNKTIERMKRAEALAKSRASGSAETTPSGDSESAATAATADGGFVAMQEPSTPAESAAKRRKLQSIVAETQPQAIDAPPPVMREASAAATVDDLDATGGDASSTTTQAGVAQTGIASPPAAAPPSPSSTPVPATTPSKPSNGAPYTPQVGAAAKQERMTSEKKPKSSVTELRSAIALVECIEELGGALDTLLVPQALDAFVERNRDRYSSQVLNLREKRKRDKAIAKAVDKGTLKKTFVKVRKPGDHAQRTIVYVPSIDPARLQRYCDAVVNGEEGWSRATDTVSILHLRSGQVHLPAEDITSLSIRRPWQDSTTLDVSSFEADPHLAERMRAPFLAQDMPVKQFLGHASGPVARLVLFHLSGIDAINANVSSKVQRDPRPSIDISYFWTEASLELFLALCGLRYYSPSLEAAYQDPATRYQAVCELPSDVKEAIGLPSALDAAPPPEIQTAIYSLAAQLQSMGVLEAVPDADTDDSARTLTLPCTRFELRDRVPIYNWKAKGSTKPVLSVASVGASIDRARAFWQNTALICSKRIRATSSAAQPESGFQAANVSRGVQPDLLKTKAWRMGHTIRPVQRRFLLRFLRAGEPLPSDKAVQLASWISLVPADAVKRFWTLALADLGGRGGEVAARKRHMGWSLDIQGLQIADIEAREMRRLRDRDREGRKTTLRKARELRDKRVRSFEQWLTDAFQSMPAAEAYRNRIEWALRQIRKRYIESHPGFDAGDARRAIERGVAIASGVGVRLSSIRRPPADNDGDDAQVEDEGAAGGSQGGVPRPRRPRNPAKARRRKKGAEGRKEQTSRRSTTSANYWTPQRNELLRDAAVILQARDRARGRSDWSALAQIWDEEDRSKNQNFVSRQWKLQLGRMRGEFGEEGYLSALERQWTAVSREARSKGELADPAFPSATDFDLKQHIEFLRARIDKDAIFASLEKPSQINPLPLDLAKHDFTQGWKDEFRYVPPETKWEDFHNQESGHNHRRQGMLLGNALVLEPTSNDVPARQRPTEPVAAEGAEAQLRAQMAEAAVRIVILSDDRRCSATDKAEFCRRFGEDEIEAAVVRLLETRVIRPTTAEVTQRRQPGTNFALTDDFFVQPQDHRLHRSDEIGLRHTLARLDGKLEQSMSAPLFVEPVETDGEAACLGTMLSNNLMTADIDVAPFADLRGHHAFNARVLNDDEIETVLSISITAAGLEQGRSATVKMPSPPAATNGRIANDELAEAESWLEVFTIAADEDLEALQEVKHLLDAAGPEGVELGKCLAILRPACLAWLLNRGRAPAFVAGHSHVRLVSAQHIRLYTLPRLTTGSTSNDNSGDESLRQPARLWLDIHGNVLEDKWRRLVELLAQACVQRPGISLDTLCAKFRSSCTAVEVFEAVQALENTQRFETRWVHVDEVGVAVASVHPRGGIWAGFEDDDDEAN